MEKETQKKVPEEKEKEKRLQGWSWWRHCKEGSEW